MARALARNNGCRGITSSGSVSDSDEISMIFMDFFASERETVRERGDLSVGRLRGDFLM